MSLALLPSPFLPGTAYAPLLKAFTLHGVHARLTDPTLGRGEVAEALVERWVETTQDVDVLVAHSNAGLLAPRVRDRGRAGQRVVFMDAALLPDAGSTALAPPDLRAMLASRADADGLLPRWTRWWDPDALTGVIPRGLFAAIDAACPRLQQSYLDDEIEAPSGWTKHDNTYLAFGDTYAEERRRAQRHGWPTATIPGGHLHFLHDPDGVAAAVLRLADRPP